MARPAGAPSSGSIAAIELARAKREWHQTLRNLQTLKSLQHGQAEMLGRAALSAERAQQSKYQDAYPVTACIEALRIRCLRSTYRKGDAFDAPVPANGATSDPRPLDGDQRAPSLRVVIGGERLSAHAFADWAARRPVEGTLAIAEPFVASADDAAALENEEDVKGAILLVGRRGLVPCYARALAAQRAGALAVIVAHDDSMRPDEVVAIDADPGETADIPVVMVSYNDGERARRLGPGAPVIFETDRGLVWTDEGPCAGLGIDSRASNPRSPVCDAALKLKGAVAKLGLFFDCTHIVLCDEERFHDSGGDEDFDPDWEELWLEVCMDVAQDVAQ